MEAGAGFFGGRGKKAGVGAFCRGTGPVSISGVLSPVRLKETPAVGEGGQKSWKKCGRRTEACGPPVRPEQSSHGKRANKQSKKSQPPPHQLANHMMHTYHGYLVFGAQKERHKKKWKFVTVDLVALYEDDDKRDYLPLPGPPSSHLARHKFSSPSHAAHVQRPHLGVARMHCTVPTEGSANPKIGTPLFQPAQVPKGKGEEWSRQDREDQ